MSSIRERTERRQVSHLTCTVTTMSHHEIVDIFGTTVTITVAAAEKVSNVEHAFEVCYDRSGEIIGEISPVSAWRWRRTLPDGSQDEGLSRGRNSACALMIERERAAKHFAGA